MGSGVLNLLSLHPPPFGFKVFFAAFGWASAILTILLAQAAMDLYFGKTLPVVLHHAGIGVFIFTCHCLPVLGVDRFRSFLI